MATYSYDPTKANQPGVDRMRLELGDTIFAPGELTAALCDEEYTAIIGSNKRWGRAKLKCLEAILMKYSHQTNVSIDGLSYSFSDRVKMWRDLWEQARKADSLGVPTANPLALNGNLGGGPYFYNDMMRNPRIGGPVIPYEDKK